LASIWITPAAAPAPALHLLSEIKDDEADKLDSAADLSLHSRLGCQAIIVKPGDIVVEIPSWNRNYTASET